MRIQCDFLYAVIDGRRSLFDAGGNPVSLDTILKQFSPTEDNGVPVRLIADDGRHDEIPFDLAVARSIIGQKKRAFFCTSDGRKVTVYSASALGDFPVVGLDPTGHPCLWDKSGTPKDEDPTLQLVIQEERGDADTNPGAAEGIEKTGNPLDELLNDE
mgnify:CR=1 FL=1